MADIYITSRTPTVRVRDMPHELEWPQTMIEVESESGDILCLILPLGYRLVAGTGEAQP